MTETKTTVNVIAANVYEIDWTKVNTLEDVVLVLKCLNISFTDQYQNIDQIKHLCTVKQQMPVATNVEDIPFEEC